MSKEEEFNKEEELDDDKLETHSGDSTEIPGDDDEEEIEVEIEEPKKVKTTKTYEVKKTKSISWLKGLLIACSTLVIVIAIAYFTELTTITTSEQLSIYSGDNGSYDYCVQWGGWIEREKITYECFVMVEPGTLCNYMIDDNNSIEVTIYNETCVRNQDASCYIISQTKYPCSQLVKSIEVN